MAEVPEPVQFMAGVALVLFIVTQLVKLAPELMRWLKNEKTGGPMVASGQLPREYWQGEMRRAVAEVMNPLIQTQNTILDRLTNAEEKQTEALRELTVEIREDRAHQRGLREAENTRRNRR